MAAVLGADDRGERGGEGGEHAAGTIARSRAAVSGSRARRRRISASPLVLNCVQAAPHSSIEVERERPASGSPQATICKCYQLWIARLSGQIEHGAVTLRSRGSGSETDQPARSPRVPDFEGPGQ